MMNEKRKHRKNEKIIYRIHKIFHDLDWTWGESTETPTPKEIAEAISHLRENLKTEMTVDDDTVWISSGRLRLVVERKDVGENYRIMLDVELGELADE